MIRLFILSGLLYLAFTFFSCEREEFDFIENSITDHTPDIHLLPSGNLELNILGVDTLSLMVDSTYCEQLTPDSVNFISYEFPDVLYKWNIRVTDNPDLLQTGKYDLIAIQRLELIYDQQTGIEDTLIMNFQVLDPMNEMVEITESRLHFNSVYNRNSNQISGYIEGPLVDDDGNQWHISSFFNRIERFAL